MRFLILLLISFNAYSMDAKFMIKNKIRYYEELRFEENPGWKYLVRSIDHVDKFFIYDKKGNELYTLSADGVAADFIGAETFSTDQVNFLVGTIWNYGAHSQKLKIIDPKKKKIVYQFTSFYSVSLENNGGHIIIRGTEYTGAKPKSVKIKWSHRGVKKIH